MKFNKLKTRRGKLEEKLRIEICQTINDDNSLIAMILQHVDEYEKANLATIEKLKKQKLVDTKKINGALKQAINAHGPITKVLIGSATKRVYGALLESTKPKENIFKRLLRWVNIK